MLYTLWRRDLQLAVCIPSHDNQCFVIGWIGAVTAIRFVVTSLPPVWSRCKRSSQYALCYIAGHASHRRARRRASIDFKIPGRETERWSFFFQRTNFLALFWKLKLQRDKLQERETFVIPASLSERDVVK